MNDSLVSFKLPADYVLARASPTPEELRFGYDHDWIDAASVVRIALALYERGDVPEHVEELALLLSDNFGRVPGILASVDAQPGATGSVRRLWLYLALAWVRDHPEEFPDRYETIEMLYADFDYPDSIAGLVRFMPAPPGEASGLSALDERWAAYLEQEARWLASRDADLP